MDLNLTFANGKLSGTGADDVGNFLIRVVAGAGECYWTKSYLGAHDVYYRGFREGKGIWGTWEITVRDHGGFHIWPRRASECEESAVAAKPEEWVEAVGTEISPRVRQSPARRLR